MDNSKDTKDEHIYVLETENYLLLKENELLKLRLSGRTNHMPHCPACRSVAVSMVCGECGFSSVDVEG